MNVLMTYRLQAFKTEILPQFEKFKNDNITFIVQSKYSKNWLPVLIKRLNLELNINIITIEELLKGKIDNMQFDYIVQNPPYSTQVGETKTEKIWQRIIIKTYGLLKVGGEMTSVHPGSWRFISSSSRGDVSEIANIYKTNKIKYMEFNDVTQGKIDFGANTDYDIVTLIKKPSDNMATIKTKTDGLITVDISKLVNIPTDNFELFNKLIAKNGEETVDILTNGAYHTSNGFGTPAQNSSKTQDNEYRYPVIYTITENKGIIYWYGKVKINGHFGTPKLIIKKAALSSILDLNGDYGMTQFAAGIIDTPENLIKIQKVIDSPNLKSIKLNFVGAVNPVNAFIDGMGHMFKFIKEFRKDFWKEFYTDEMEQELIAEGKLDKEGKYIG